MRHRGTLTREKGLSADPGRIWTLSRQLRHDPARVSELYEASEQFREIYADLATCQEMLEKLRRLGQVDDARAEDYRNMRDQLEAELRDYLDKAAHAAEGDQP